MASSDEEFGGQHPPIICNDDGAPVSFGDYNEDRYKQLLYCGRNLGTDDIPFSDGHCGPNNGPQCESCQRLQVDPSKRKGIMKLLFPGLDDEHFIPALRSKGGSMYDACIYLISLGAPHVEFGLAFPRSNASDDGSGIPRRPTAVGAEMISSVMEVVGTMINGQTKIAEAALRRNDNNAESAILYIMDSGEDVLQAAVTDDLQNAVTYQQRYEEFQIRRQSAIQEASNEPIPETIANLRTSCTSVDGTSLTDEISKEPVIRDGHCLVPAGEATPFCTVCATEITSRYTGQRQCRTCGLCEGCISSKVVFSCPMLGNGGHLHHHALQPIHPAQRRGNICDVHGEGCLKRSPNIRWFCQECDFDVCLHCIANEVPRGYCRRYGRIPQLESTTGANGNLGSSRTQEDEETVPETATFDAAERAAAARWEGIRREPDTDMYCVVVGTGEIGTASLPTFNARSRPSTSPSRRASNRPQTSRVPRAEVGLLEEDTRALERFSLAVQENNGDATGTRGVAAACDIHHVEDLLHRAQGVTNDENTSRVFRQAVASGKVEIAGTLLLANKYAPKVKRRASEDGSEDFPQEECFCGLPLDAETAPDGAIGCLNGHAMHPSCAADQLIGGGPCPFCKSPLFFPKVPNSEAKVAQEYAQEELYQRQQKAEENTKKQIEELIARGEEVSFHVGDIVRISSDEASCEEEVMKQPKKSGWHSDMAKSCGMTGRVTGLVWGDGESPNDTATNGDSNSLKLCAIRVRVEDQSLSYGTEDQPFVCRECERSFNGQSSLTDVICLRCKYCRSCCRNRFSCSTSFAEWNWTPSVLSLVCPASSSESALWETSVADKATAAEIAAENHIRILRAELKAVIAARAVVKEDMEKTISDGGQASLARQLPDRYSATLQDAASKISSPDWCRARHLLLLARHWGDSKRATDASMALQATIESGEVDSAARIVRRYNAARVADDCKWADAAMERREYVMESAKAQLLAWASSTAPKTGYCLGPNSRFFSKAETLDSDGVLWLQVDETSFADLTKLNGVVVSDLEDRKLTRALVGAQVKRSEGGRDASRQVGVITGVPKTGMVSVRWERHGRFHEYQHAAGRNGRHELVFANPPAPPPQGWFCTRPRGAESPAIVRCGRSALRCFGCGDGLIPLPNRSIEKFSPVKKDDILNTGDSLIVAATLEPVEVVSFDGDKVVCSFSKDATMPQKRQKTSMGECEGFTAWYRPEDLVYPKAREEVILHEEEEEYVTTSDGRSRSRRELLLELGDLGAARKKWEEGTHKKSQSRGDTCSFASCVRGHLLHARCFQGALLAGSCCPAPGCTEPLWVPKVKQTQRDADACCGANNQNTEALQRDLADNTDSPRAEREADMENRRRISIEGVDELKMCPACYSGPLFNENCDDMSSHHGQCVTSALGRRRCSYTVSASEIAQRLMGMTAGQTVAEVLPKCPTHNSVVMFNGCMDCGHLFTDTSWNQLPKWDPSAKAALEVDKKKREQAIVLATQIRDHAAMLQFERDALKNSWGEGLGPDARGEALSLPPMPPPAEEFV